MDPVAAKEFLISKVVEEAALEHAQLSEVERKMLHFTEVHASLPDIFEVNAEFEREYDADEYEDKIAQLLRKARGRDSDSLTREQEWKNALDALKHEDHYILVMVHLAFGSGSSLPQRRSRDFLIYRIVGIVVVLVALLVAFWQAQR